MPPTTKTLVLFFYDTEDRKYVSAAVWEPPWSLLGATMKYVNAEDIKNSFDIAAELTRTYPEARRAEWFIVNKG